mmetsp:Transcript_21450/g.71064  ORF Transcript_21450/g.71064 Transcript_21450/m.71064 type:complete len:146 (-) Transcript_21450:125-562(-)
MALVNRCIARSLLIKARSTWSKGVHQFQNARPSPGHVRTFMPSIAKQAKYEGELPKLGTNEFVVFSPEVSGPGGMAVPAELGEVVEICCKEGDTVDEDMVVAVIETCKASVEARCRSAGVVKQVLVKNGEEVWELHPLLVVEKKA